MKLDVRIAHMGGDGDLHEVPGPDDRTTGDLASQSGVPRCCPGAQRYRCELSRPERLGCVATLVRRPWLELVRPRQITRPHLLQAAKAGIGAALAWWLAVLTHPSVPPYFAPMAVLLIVQPTVYDSLSRAAQRVAGVVVGVAAALALSEFVTIDAFTVGLVVLVGLLIGWSLRLGPQGVVQVPISAMLVLVAGSTESGYAQSRIVDTLIGAGVGMALVLLVPTAPAPEKLSQAVVRPIKEMAVLLSSVGHGLGSTWSLQVAQEWHGEAVGLVEEIVRLRAQFASQKVEARWNTWALNLRRDLERIEVAVEATRQMGIQLRAMTEAIVEAAAEAPTMPVLGQLVSSVGDVLVAFGRSVEAQNPGSRAELIRTVSLGEELLRSSEARARQRWHSDVSRWLTFGLVLAGAQRILGEASQVAGTDRLDPALVN